MNQLTQNILVNVFFNIGFEEFKIDGFRLDLSKDLLKVKLLEILMLGVLMIKVELIYFRNMEIIYGQLTHILMLFLNILVITMKK